jgi:hypothetical protein
MKEVLWIALNIGLFFVACTVVFLVGFVVDVRAQAGRVTGVRREAAGEPAPAQRRPETGE